MSKTGEDRAEDARVKNAEALEAATAPNDEQDEETGRRMDPEIRVIAGIKRDLDRLDERARNRVVAYLHARYSDL